MDIISSDVFEQAVALNKEPTEVFPWTHLDIGKVFKVRSLAQLFHSFITRKSNISCPKDDSGDKMIAQLV